MNQNHTLAARLRDLGIELELWILGWFVTSMLMAGSTYLYLQPEANAGLWRDYLLARALNIVGLGTIPVPDWYTPAVVIQFVQEKLPPEVVTTWDRDFLLILQSPIYALVLLPFAYLVFFDKKA